MIGSSQDFSALSSTIFPQSGDCVVGGGVRALRVTARTNTVAGRHGRTPDTDLGCELVELDFVGQLDELERNVFGPEEHGSTRCGSGIGHIHRRATDRKSAVV